MEIDEDISDIEANVPMEYSKSFGDISRITADSNEEESKNRNSHEIETDESYQEDDNEEENNDGNLHETETDESYQEDDNEEENNDGNLHETETDESYQEDGNEEENNDGNLHETETDESYQEASISKSVEDSSYDPTSFIEVSDILDLVGKNWSIFRVSPLWNFNFNTSHLDLLSKQLNKFLMKHNITNLKNQNNLLPQISVEIEAKEAHHENIALKIQIVNKKTNTKLYTGLLLKSPHYTEKYNKDNLSDMPLLMVHGHKTTITSVHNWLTNCFDCVIRPYEFTLYQFIWLIAISMGDAGQSYNEIVLYHYLYEYELSKGKMDITFSIKSEFLRSALVKLSLNRSPSEDASFCYSNLIKVQSEIEDRFNITSGINPSKLKLKAFKAPKVASFNVSGKIQVWSSSLLDLMLKFLMELENNKCVY